VLQEKKLSAAQFHFDATWQKFQEAIDVLPEEDKGKKLKPIQVSFQTTSVNCFIARLSFGLE